MVLRDRGEQPEKLLPESKNLGWRQENAFVLKLKLGLTFSLSKEYKYAVKVLVKGVKKV